MLDNEIMMGEILRELTALKDINDANSDQILIWAQRMMVQRVLDHIREHKESNSIRLGKHKCDNARQNRNRGINYCKYCGTG